MCQKVEGENGERWGEREGGFRRFGLFEALEQSQKERVTENARNQWQVKDETTQLGFGPKQADESLRKATQLIM